MSTGPKQKSFGVAASKDEVCPRFGGSIRPGDTVTFIFVKSTLQTSAQANNANPVYPYFSTFCSLLSKRSLMFPN